MGHDCFSNGQRPFPFSWDDDVPDYVHAEARPRLHRCCDPRAPRAGTTLLAWTVVVRAEERCDGGLRQLVQGERPSKRVQRAQADWAAPRPRGPGGTLRQELLDAHGVL